jgi:hypothetical protein
MEVGCHGVVSEKASCFLSMYQIYQKKQEKHCLLLFFDDWMHGVSDVDFD